MTPVDFEYLSRFLRERSGLTLSADKQYLAESRLLPLVKRHGLKNLGELVAKLKLPNSDVLGAQIVEAMTTNETFFFRDKMPFEHFRHTVMPALIAARARERRIRIWCTAASTGQEPYSLAMILDRMNRELSGFRVEILATDLSEAVLARAKEGNYSQFEVQRGLPIDLLLKYFVQVGDRWQIVPALRAMVQFRPLNLLKDFSPLGTFDVVFCRNVLIYFDQETKIGVLNRLALQMPKDGFLSLGAAETVVGLTSAFKPLGDKRGLYVPDTEKLSAAGAAPSRRPVRAGSQ